MTKRRLNDASPDEWGRAFKACYRNKVDIVTQEDLDALFADGEFKDEDGYDTYEEYLAKASLFEDQSAMDKQVSGNHYKELGLQPLEMTYANFGYSGLKASVYTKVNKYLLRDKESEVEDIKKAIHCLEILLEKANS